MNAFDPAELAYLAERRLARLATVGRNGTPHVTPVGMWHHNPDTNSIDITGHDKPIRPATAPPRWPRSPPAAGLHPPQVNDLVRPRPELSAGVWRARGCRVPVSW